MEGQFLVRQIYDDEITYNIIGAAVEILSELNMNFYFIFPLNGIQSQFIMQIFNISQFYDGNGAVFSIDKYKSGLGIN